MRKFVFLFSALVLLFPLPVFAATGAAGASVPHDLSPLGMFVSADWVVKTVMIGLAIASVVTWTIWLVKALEIRRLKKALRCAHGICGDAGRLAAAAGSDLPATCADFVAAARTEVALSTQSGGSAEGIKERTESRLMELEEKTHQSLIGGTGWLATIGATAPFVGLFGTVWGVMNSFIGISQANTTNLAVVAPGIAEALLATAMGLIAAVPAVVLYNFLARQMGGIRSMYRQLSMQVMRLVSRDLDCTTQPEDKAKQRSDVHEAA